METVAGVSADVLHLGRFGSTDPAFMWTAQQAAKSANSASRKAGVTIAFDGLGSLAPGLHASRFRFDNGLTVMLLPDPMAPIFAYQTWFKVGSRHEKRGKTGIAHLFEHLMFKGTKNHKTGSFDHEMEKRGAQTNAATWVDWTYYRESLPAIGENFDLVVDFEADRMVNLALTQDLVDAEREVVKNERRQRVDNSISGSLDELTYQTAFGAHPYGHPTIGYMEDLDSMSMKEFETFYRQYYAPNNAVVVVAGAMEPEVALTKIAKAYGKIPSQKVPEEIESPIARGGGVKRAELKRATDAERLSLVFHAPAQLDPSHAALQVAAEVLCGGDTGRLVDDLVFNKEWVQDIGSSMSPFALAGLFQIDMSMKPGLASAESEAKIVAALRKLAIEGPTDAEVEKCKNRIEASFVRALVDVDGKAEQIGHFESTTGDAGYMLQVLQRLRGVSKDTVRSAVGRWLDPDRRIAVRLVPEAS